jgi:hypothetical protein
VDSPKEPPRTPYANTIKKESKDAPAEAVGPSYLRAVCTLVNVVLRVDPTSATTVMIATEMPAAIRPYSIAVAPDSFARKLLNALMRRKYSSALRPSGVDTERNFGLDYPARQNCS